MSEIKILKKLNHPNLIKVPFKKFLLKFIKKKKKK